LGDGLWLRTSGEGGAARDWRRYEGDLGLSADLIGTDHGQGVFQARFPGPDYESAGAPGKRWVQVEIAQRGFHIVWKVNGYVIGEFDNISWFTAGTVMIGTLDAFTSIASPKEDNYVIFDNVRVVNLDTEPELSSVRVEAFDPQAAEPADSGTFTITREFGALSKPLEVTFRLTGTATPGVDYKTNNLAAGKVTIPAGLNFVDLVIEPIDNLVGEPPETVIITLTGNTAYEMRDPISATIDLLDDGDTVGVNIAALDPYTYERVVEDQLAFEIIREGDITADLTVSLTYGGTATGDDYDGAFRSVTLPAGADRTTLALTPKDDALVEGDETVIVSVVAGPGYAVGPNASATGTIVDDDPAVKPVLFAENFNTDTAANWLARFSADNAIDDYTAEFAYDYSFDAIPPAPHGSGDTRGLRLAVNKNDPTTGGAAGLNLYPKGQNFTGAYALRFDMYLTYSTAVGGTTEHALCGINHSGDVVNRHATAGSDGVWFAVETDGSASGGGRSYVSYLGGAGTPTFEAKPASAFAPYFTSPPYQARGAASGRWVDVEVAQAGGKVTKKINGVTVFERADTGAFTSGNVMVGHMDTFSSIGAVGNYVIYDNLRVVRLEEAPPAQPTITRVQLSGNQVQLDVTAPGASAGQLVLEGSSALPGGFQTVTGASVQNTGPGQFQVTAPSNAAPVQFYRIKR